MMPKTLKRRTGVYYKILLSTGESPYAFFKYSLPRKVKGRWRPGKRHNLLLNDLYNSPGYQRRLDPCHYGFHACTRRHVHRWDAADDGRKLYRCVLFGPIVGAYDKTVAYAIQLLRPIRRYSPEWYRVVYGKRGRHA